MRFGNFKEPSKRGIVIFPRIVGFTQRKIRVRPVGVEPRGFVQLPQLGLVFRGQQPPDVLFECVKPQPPLALGEFSKAQGIMPVVRPEQAPQQARVQFRQRSQRTAFPQRRPQGHGIHTEHAHLDGEGSPAGGISPIDHIIRVQILGHAEHGRAAEFGGWGQPVTFQFGSPSGVRIHLLACRGEPLSGQLFQALAEPVQPW